MRRPPTDLQILEEIYERYYSAFASFSPENPNRSTKVLVPIDIREIDEHFRVDGDIIFGRLYYHLDPKYGFDRPDGSKVRFFALAAGTDKHCVQFPLLASVIARLREERNKHLLTILFSTIALILSFASLVVSIVAFLKKA
jgi:hypothetical protein